MKIADGVYVHFIPTQKYKTNRIVFRMTGSLNKQTIAKRALVSQMLATANQTYPTVQSFKERLAFLYGTQLSTRVSTKGLTHHDQLLPKRKPRFSCELVPARHCQLW